MTTKSNKTKTPTKRTKPGSEDRSVISQMVLDGMRGGLSAFKACQVAGVPNSTFLRWVDDDATLAENYARAREDLIERMATEIMEISDQDVGVAVDGKKTGRQCKNTDYRLTHANGCCPNWPQRSLATRSKCLAIQLIPWCNALSAWSLRHDRSATSNTRVGAAVTQPQPV